MTKFKFKRIASPCHSVKFGNHTNYCELFCWAPTMIKVCCTGCRGCQVQHCYGWSGLLSCCIPDLIEYITRPLIKRPKQIAEILDVFSSYSKHGTMYVAVEYMDGGSIDNIKSKLGIRIPEAPLAYILRQVLSGVCTHHEQLKRIHRDLSPKAVLFNSRGEVKITSTPHMKFINLNARRNGIKETYIPPERLQGKVYGYPSDIWSVGIIAVELATGEYPYDTTVKCLRPPPEPLCQ